MKKEILIKEGDYIRFFINCKEDKEYSLEFEVFEVQGWTLGNEPLNERQELFLKGVIRWDGCSHIYFGDEIGYIHLCGNGCFENVKKVLDAVWNKAEKEIVNFDKEVAY